MDKEKIKFELSDLEIKVLKIIKDNPYIKVEEIAKTIYFSFSYVKLVIHSLKQKGIIERIGGRGGYWFIRNSI